MVPVATRVVRAPHPQVELLGWMAAWWLLVCSLAGSAALGAVPIAAAMAIAVGCVALLWRPSLELADGLGWANRVTLVRAIVVSGVVALTVFVLAGDAGTLVPLLALAAVAVALDGVDGLVARTTGTASDLGARFDAELDALLISALSVLAASHFGPWVLAIGLARYLLLLAQARHRWLRRPLPPSRWRRIVATVQPVAIILALSGLVGAAVGAAVLTFALGLLTWSFGRDIAWWYARR